MQFLGRKDCTYPGSTGRHLKDLYLYNKLIGFDAYFIRWGERYRTQVRGFFSHKERMKLNGLCARQ